MNDEESWPRVTIGRPDGDWMSIRVYGRMHSDASDFWDGNWLMSSTKVSVAGFRGDSGGSLRAEELRGFRRQMEDLYASLDGEALLETMELWVSLCVTVDRRGVLRVTGVIKDSAESFNELSFLIGDLDQSDLPQIIADIKEVEAKFPVIGEM